MGLMLLVPIQPSLLLNKQLTLTKLLKLKELKLSKSSNQVTMISSRKEDQSLLLQWLLVVSSFLLYLYLSQAEYHASVQNQTEKRTRRKSRQMFYQLRFNVNWQMPPISKKQEPSKNNQKINKNTEIV